MPYAVLIARQRSGTSAFNQLVARGLGLVSQGEILDPARKSPVISETEGAATWPRLQAFLDRLHEDDKLHLLDIKVRSLGSVCQPFRSPALPPPVFDLFRKHQARIIRLHRHPVAQWVSGMIAVRSGVWHQDTAGEAPPEKVRVKPVELENFIAACAKEDRLLADWLDGLASLNLHYDEVFAGEDYSGLLAQVGDFLGIAPERIRTNARPALHKIAHASLAENIENLAEVAFLMPVEAARAAEGTAGELARGPIGLDAFPASLHARINACKAILNAFVADGVLKRSHFQGKVVLDWECGDGAYSAAFALGGARMVIANDLWLDPDRLPAAFRDSQVFRFRRAGIRDIETEIPGAVDLAFANTVTEHMPDLPASFAALHRVIRPGGYLFVNHDNYYQPVGSHDHGFLNYGAGGIIRQGPACWDAGADCALSQPHREEVARRFPWTWDARNEERRNPAACRDCDYYKRSQPWAHLLYQGDFASLFAQDSFSTGKARSSLNKVTIFQLRQFLIEAGFTIEVERRDSVANVPPPALLQGPHPFTALDLTTTMYRVLARR